MISNKLYVLLFHLIIAVSSFDTDVNYTAVRSVSDSPILMKILQSVDAATSDDHLFDVTLKLLKSLCVCMHETLKVNERKKTFHGDTNSLQIEDESNEANGKVLELYTKIYNNTCFNLQQEFAIKLNRMHVTLQGNEKDLMKKSNCGKKIDITTEKVIEISSSMLPIVQNDINSKLKQILFETLILTQPYHKYTIKRYNLFKQSKSQLTVENSRHSIIVIITLRTVQNINKTYEDSSVISELNNTLYTKSPVDIDIIDTKYGSDLTESTENVKTSIASECNLQSIYFFLVETEKRNFTKVFKVLKRNGTIKLYIDVLTMRNHCDYSKICCGDNGKTMCDIDLIKNDVLSKEVTKTQKSKTNQRLEDTISKIKALVNMYDDKKKLNKLNTVFDTELKKNEGFSINYVTLGSVGSKQQEKTTPKIKTNLMEINFQKRENLLLPLNLKYSSSMFDKTLNKSSLQIIKKDNLCKKMSKLQNGKSIKPSILGILDTNKVSTLTLANFKTNKDHTENTLFYSDIDYTKSNILIDTTNKTYLTDTLDNTVNNPIRKQEISEFNTIDYSDTLATTSLKEDDFKEQMGIINSVTTFAKPTLLIKEEKISTSLPNNDIKSMNSSSSIIKHLKVNKTNNHENFSHQVNNGTKISEFIGKQYTTVQKSSTEKQNTIIDDVDDEMKNNTRSEDNDALSEAKIKKYTSNPDIQIHTVKYETDLNRILSGYNVVLVTPTQQIFKTNVYKNYNSEKSDNGDIHKKEINNNNPITTVQYPIEQDVMSFTEKHPTGTYTILTPTPTQVLFGTAFYNNTNMEETFTGQNNIIKGIHRNPVAIDNHAVNQENLGSTKLNYISTNTITLARTPTQQSINRDKTDDEYNIKAFKNNLVSSIHSIKEQDLVNLTSQSDTHTTTNYINTIRLLSTPTQQTVQTTLYKTTDLSETGYTNKNPIPTEDNATLVSTSINPTVQTTNPVGKELHESANLKNITDSIDYDHNHELNVGNIFSQTENTMQPDPHSSTTQTDSDTNTMSIINKEILSNITQQAFQNALNDTTNLLITESSGKLGVDNSSSTRPHRLDQDTISYTGSNETGAISYGNTVPIQQVFQNTSDENTDVTDMLDDNHYKIKAPEKNTNLKEQNTNEQDELSFTMHNDIDLNTIPPDDFVLVTPAQETLQNIFYTNTNLVKTYSENNINMETTINNPISFDQQQSEPSFTVINAKETSTVSAKHSLVLETLIKQKNQTNIYTNTDLDKKISTPITVLQYLTNEGKVSYTNNNIITTENYVNLGAPSKQALSYMTTNSKKADGNDNTVKVYINGFIDDKQYMPSFTIRNNTNTILAKNSTMTQTQAVQTTLCKMTDLSETDCLNINTIPSESNIALSYESINPTLFQNTLNQNANIEITTDGLDYNHNLEVYANDLISSQAKIVKHNTLSYTEEIDQDTNTISIGNQIISDITTEKTFQKTLNENADLSTTGNEYNYPRKNTNNLSSTKPHTVSQDVMNYTGLYYTGTISSGNSVIRAVPTLQALENTLYKNAYFEKPDKKTILTGSDGIVDFGRTYPFLQTTNPTEQAFQNTIIINRNADFVPRISTQEKLQSSFSTNTNFIKTQAGNNSKKKTFIDSPTNFKQYQGEPSFKAKNDVVTDTISAESKVVLGTKIQQENQFNVYTDADLANTFTNTNSKLEKKTNTLISIKQHTIEEDKVSFTTQNNMLTTENYINLETLTKEDIHKKNFAPTKIKNTEQKARDNNLMDVNINDLIANKQDVPSFMVLNKSNTILTTNKMLLSPTEQTFQNTFDNIISLEKNNVSNSDITINNSITTDQHMVKQDISRLQNYTEINISSTVNNLRTPNQKPFRHSHLNSIITAEADDKNYYSSKVILNNLNNIGKAKVKATSLTMHNFTDTNTVSPVNNKPRSKPAVLNKFFTNIVLDTTDNVQDNKIDSTNSNYVSKSITKHKAALEIEDPVSILSNLNQKPISSISNDEIERPTSLTFPEKNFHDSLTVQTDGKTESFFGQRVPVSNITLETDIEKKFEITRMPVINPNEENIDNIFLTPESKTEKISLDFSFANTEHNFLPYSNLRVTNTLLSLTSHETETNIDLTKSYVEDNIPRRPSSEYATMNTGSLIENQNNLTVDKVVTHNNMLPNITTKYLNQIYSSVVSPTKQQMKRLVSKENRVQEDTLFTSPSTSEHYKELEDYDQIGLEQSKELQILDVKIPSATISQNIPFISKMTNLKNTDSLKTKPHFTANLLSTTIQVQKATKKHISDTAFTYPETHLEIPTNVATTETINSKLNGLHILNHTFVDQTNYKAITSALENSLFHKVTEVNVTTQPILLATKSIRNQTIQKPEISLETTSLSYRTSNNILTVKKPDIFKEHKIVNIESPKKQEQSSLENYIFNFERKTALPISKSESLSSSNFNSNSNEHINYTNNHLLSKLIDTTMNTILEKVEYLSYANTTSTRHIEDVKIQTVNTDYKNFTTPVASGRIKLTMKTTTEHTQDFYLNDHFATLSTSRESIYSTGNLNVQKNKLNTKHILQNDLTADTKVDVSINVSEHNESTSFTVKETKENKSEYKIFQDQLDNNERFQYNVTKNTTKLKTTSSIQEKYTTYDIPVNSEMVASDKVKTNDLFIASKNNALENIFKYTNPIHLTTDPLNKIASVAKLNILSHENATKNTLIDVITQQNNETSKSTSVILPSVIPNNGEPSFSKNEFTRLENKPSTLKSIKTLIKHLNNTENVDAVSLEYTTLHNKETLKYKDNYNSVDVFYKHQNESLLKKDFNNFDSRKGITEPTIKTAVAVEKVSSIDKTPEIKSAMKNDTKQCKSKNSPNSYTTTPTKYTNLSRRNESTETTDLFAPNEIIAGEEFGEITNFITVPTNSDRILETTSTSNGPQMNKELEFFGVYSDQNRHTLNNYSMETQVTSPVTTNTLFGLQRTNETHTTITKPTMSTEFPMTTNVHIYTLKNSGNITLSQILSTERSQFQNAENVSYFSNIFNTYTAKNITSPYSMENLPENINEITSANLNKNINVTSKLVIFNSQYMATEVSKTNKTVKYPSQIKENNDVLPTTAINAKLLTVATYTESENTIQDKLRMISQNISFDPINFLTSTKRTEENQQIMDTETLSYFSNTFNHITAKNITSAYSMENLPENINEISITAANLNKNINETPQLVNFGSQYMATEVSKTNKTVKFPSQIIENNDVLPTNAKLSTVSTYNISENIIQDKLRMISQNISFDPINFLTSTKRTEENQQIKETETLSYFSNTFDTISAKNISSAYSMENLPDNIKEISITAANLNKNINKTPQLVIFGSQYMATEVSKTNKTTKFPSQIIENNDDLPTTAIKAKLSTISTYTVPENIIQDKLRMISQNISFDPINFLTSTKRTEENQQIKDSTSISEIYSLNETNISSDFITVQSITDFTTLGNIGKRRGVDNIFYTDSAFISQNNKLTKQTKNNGYLNYNNIKDPVLHSSQPMQNTKVISTAITLPSFWDSWKENKSTKFQNSYFTTKPIKPINFNYKTTKNADIADINLFSLNFNSESLKNQDNQSFVNSDTILVTNNYWTTNKISKNLHNTRGTNKNNDHLTFDSTDIYKTSTTNIHNKPTYIPTNDFHNEEEKTNIISSNSEDIQLKVKDNVMPILFKERASTPEPASTYSIPVMIHNSINTGTQKTYGKYTQIQSSKNPSTSNSSETYFRTARLNLITNEPFSRRKNYEYTRYDKNNSTNYTFPSSIKKDMLTDNGSSTTIGTTNFSTKWVSTILSNSETFTEGHSRNDQFGIKSFEFDEQHNLQSLNIPLVEAFESIMTKSVDTTTQHYKGSKNKSVNSITTPVMLSSSLDETINNFVDNKTVVTSMPRNSQLDTFSEPIISEKLVIPDSSERIQTKLSERRQENLPFTQTTYSTDIGTLPYTNAPFANENQKIDTIKTDFPEYFTILPQISGLSKVTQAKGDINKKKLYYEKPKISLSKKYALKINTDYRKKHKQYYTTNDSLLIWTRRFMVSQELDKKSENVKYISSENTTDITVEVTKINSKNLTLSTLTNIVLKKLDQNSNIAVSASSINQNNAKEDTKTNSSDLNSTDDRDLRTTTQIIAKTKNASHFVASSEFLDAMNSYSTTKLYNVTNITEHHTKPNDLLQNTTKNMDVLFNKNIFELITERKHLKLLTNESKSSVNDIFVPITHKNITISQRKQHDATSTLKQSTYISKKYEKHNLPIKTANKYGTAYKLDKQLKKYITISTKTTRTIKYNTYKPTTEDLDSPINLEARIKIFKKGLSTSKENIVKGYHSGIRIKNTPACALLRNLSHHVNPNLKSFIELVKVSNCSQDAPPVISKSKVVKEKFRRNKIITKNYITLESNIEKPKLLDPFVKTNLYPIKIVSPKPQRKVLRRIQIGVQGKNKEIMTMNTGDFFSQRRFMMTPRNHINEVFKIRPESMNIRVYKPTSVPKQVVLRPKFDRAEQARRNFRPKPLFYENKDTFYRDEYQNYRRSNAIPWKNKIDFMQKVLNKKEPVASQYNVLARPYVLEPSATPKFLRDRVDFIRNYLINKDFVKSTTQRDYFLDSPLDDSGDVFVDDDDDDDEILKPISLPLKKNFWVPKEVPTTSKRPRRTRPRRTIFFLSPTVPYNRYF